MESQLSQPGPSQSLSRSTVDSSQNSLPEFTNAELIPRTITQNSVSYLPSSSGSNVPNSSLRCQLCTLEVQNNWANPCGQFGILQNCCCIFCANCIEAKHSKRNNVCPVCSTISNRLVQHSEFVTSESEKRTLFGSLANVPISTLRCQLCTLEVQNNWANPCGQFGILQNCCCIFCANCIEAKHSKRNNVCPVCSTISNRLVKHFDFVTSESEKRTLFGSMANAQNSGPQCQLCLLEVQNNWTNSGGQFGILQNCRCIFCANCIEANHSTRNNVCPVCSTISNRLVKHSEFVTSESEKRTLFGSMANVQNSGPRCQLCTLEVQNNPANPGGQFGILQNCSCIFCARCINKKRLTSFRCPICDVESLRYIVQNIFVQNSPAKRGLFPETATASPISVNYSRNNVRRRFRYLYNSYWNYKYNYYRPSRSSPTNRRKSLSWLGDFFKIFCILVAVYYIWESLSMLDKWPILTIFAAACYIWRSSSSYGLLFKTIGFLLAANFIWESSPMSDKWLNITIFSAACFIWRSWSWLVHLFEPFCIMVAVYYIWESSPMSDKWFNITIFAAVYFIWRSSLLWDILHFISIFVAVCFIWESSPMSDKWFNISIFAAVYYIWKSSSWWDILHFISFFVAAYCYIRGSSK